MAKGKNNKTKTNKSTVNKNDKNTVKKADTFKKSDFIIEGNANKMPLIIGTIVLLIALLIGLFSCEKTGDKKEVEKQKEVTTTVPITTTKKEVSSKKNNYGYSSYKTYYDNEEYTESVINIALIDVDKQKLNLAKEALSKAKESFIKEDILSASDLINDLSNTKDKELLKEELDKVIATYNVIKLVENYEDLVNNAENKEELDASISYKEENEIEKCIEELTDEKKKEDLNERLNKINEILTDDVAPIILGVEQDQYYNLDVNIEVIEENLKEVRLNDELYNLGDEIPLDGVYTITAIDKAFNASSVTFTLDRTKPVITLVGLDEVIVELGGTYIEEGAIYEDNIDGSGQILTPDMNTVDESVAGTYELIYSYIDMAGNEASAIRKVIINESAKPIIEYEKVNEDLYSKEYKFEIVDDSKIELVKILEGNKEIIDFQTDGEELPEPYSYTFYKNGEYTIYAKDELGNEDIIVIEITDIVIPELTLEELNSALKVSEKSEISTDIYEKEISINKEDELLVSEIKVVATDFDDNHVGYEKITTSSFANEKINGFDVECKSLETFKVQDALNIDDDNYYYIYYKVEKGSGLNKVVKENVILVEPTN